MNLARVIGRARELGPDMVAFRLSQRARRQWSRVHADLFGPPRIGHVSPPDWSAVPFFLDPVDLGWIARQFGEEWTEPSDALRREADLVLAGRVRLLTGEHHDFGSAVAWDVDPRTECAPWPAVHFTRLDALRLDEPCDVKIPWEIGRGTHLLRLAQAWHLTRDPAYAAAAMDGVAHFLVHNPPEIGPQWINGMEVGLRLVHWIWVDRLCEGAPAFSPERRARLWWGILEGARYIARFLERDEVSGNHYWFDGLGLWYAGHFLGRIGRKFADAGRSIVLDELFRQTREDGSSFEQSTGYHRLVTELMLHALRLAELEGRPADPACIERVRGMLRYTAETIQPSGRSPHLGDHDDGRVVAFADGDPWDHRHLLACGAAMGLIDWPPLLYLPEDPMDPVSQTEAAWLLGRRGTRFDPHATPPGGPQTRSAVAFPDAGVYVIRDAGLHSVWDAGPLGKAGNGVHGHADTLSGEVSVAQLPVIVDSGTWGYTAGAERRNRMRGTAAHNVVQVDGLEMAEPGTGADLWRFDGDVPVRVLEFEMLPRGGHLRAEHDGYRSRGLDVTVRRDVRTEPAGHPGLRIVDEVLGTGHHRATLRWHLGPADWRVETGDPLTLWAVYGRWHVGLSCQAGGARTSVVQAERSRRWGELHTGLVLEVELEGTLPLRFETVLRTIRDMG